MKKLLKRMLIILGVVVIGGVAYISPYLFLSPSSEFDLNTVKDVETLDQYFKDITAEGFTPAVEVVVTKAGQAIFSKSYGIANGISGEVANSEHVYHYWSMTKSFTAVAIFKLVEQGKVNLEENITTYLPHFSPVDSDGAPIVITIEQLMRHSTGLPDLDFNIVNWIHAEGEARYGDSKMVTDRLSEYNEVSWLPGTRNAYANSNYILLGAVIEVVTGETYEKYIKNAILTPLKMTSTDSIYRDDLRTRAVIGTHPHYDVQTLLVNAFGPEEGPLKGGIDGFTLKRIDDMHWMKLMYTDYNASTSLLGTGSDLSRFAQMLLNKGELDGVRVLSESSVNTMLYQGRELGYTEDMQVGDGFTPAAIGYGTMEFKIGNVTAIGHGGGGPGYSLQYLFVPEKDLSVVVLTNSTNGKSYALATKVAEIFSK